MSAQEFGKGRSQLEQAATRGLDDAMKKWQSNTADLDALKRVGELIKKYDDLRTALEAGQNSFWGSQ